LVEKIASQGKTHQLILPERQRQIRSFITSTPRVDPLKVVDSVDSDARKRLSVFHVVSPVGKIGLSQNLQNFLRA
jgi:hypothetical protein